MGIVFQAAVAYLIGCVPVAQFVARLTQGKPWGPFAETLAGVAKGVAVLWFFHPVSSIHQALLLTALVSGDQWPIHHRESGRLGLAVAGGAMSFIHPLTPIIWGVLWGVGFVMSGYRLVGRVVALGLFWLVMGLLFGWPFGLIALPASFMILARSRDDVKRMKLGQEPKHHWKSGG